MVEFDGKFTQTHDDDSKENFLFLLFKQTKKYLREWLKEEREREEVVDRCARHEFTGATDAVRLVTTCPSIIFPLLPICIPVPCAAVYSFLFFSLSLSFPSSSSSTSSGCRVFFFFSHTTTTFSSSLDLLPPY